MSEQKLKAIEQEVEKLTQQRAQIFEEWAALVKKNDREFELNGKSSSQSVAKAEQLLQSQRDISRKIMRLLEQADNLSLRLD